MASIWSLGIVGNLELMRDEEAQRLANQNLVPVMFGTRNAMVTAIAELT